MSTILTKTGLTYKQEQFCLWYVALKGNATQAMMRAGDISNKRSAEATARTYLAKPRVKARIEQLVEASKTERDLRLKVIDELAEQAFELTPQDQFTWSHKQKALDFIGRTEKMWDNPQGNVNNTFILVRSDRVDAQPIEIE